MKSSNKFKELDSLRAIAVLLVLFLHFSTAFLFYSHTYDVSVVDSESLLRQAQLIMGAKGVFLFFSLSGFLIVYLLKLKGFNKFNYRTYIIRRFWRLHPPYVAALVIFFIVHLFLGDYDVQLLVQSFFASFFYSHDLVFNHWSYILPVAWSLEVEIQFYLIAPLFIYICTKLKSLFFVFLFFCLLLAASLYQFFEFRNLVKYLLYFIPGMFIAELYFEKLLLRRKSIFFDVAFMVSFFALVLSEPSIFDSLLLLVVFYSVFNLKLLNKFFNNEFLGFIGKISFSVYLLHYPLFHLLMKLFANKILFFDAYEYDMLFQWFIFFPITIALIYPFYLIFESPYVNKLTFTGNLKGLILKTKIMFRNAVKF
ncbi:acyltransferase family protein [Shewanella sp. WPAGA9]|uniref:acyltransferase family protein n=1 Tax=Shewanella sp. ENK2 TaxID=2775245 RepID=UPI00177D08A4|nr:acyltransferase [Shewanella sp. WPAGA9]